LLDGLKQLCENYGCTVVLSTATHPAFDAIPIFSKVPAEEIVPLPKRYFQALKRVDYDIDINTPKSWAEVAGIIRSEHQSLTIVNTKIDALALLDAVTHPN